jgi:hypothetical protein
MDLAPTLARYGYALGRWQAAWRFAEPELRRAVSFVVISEAWSAFRRDAGAGEVGPAHQEAIGNTGITCTADPRRDRLLLWLTDHGAPSVAGAAEVVARMVGASRRFSGEELDLLETARDALADGGRPGSIARMLPPPEGNSDPALATLRTIATAVDRLRADLSFAENAGFDVDHRLPGGTLRHYVPGDPGAAWALDLTLIASGSAELASLPAPGSVSRVLFGVDAAPDDLVVALIEGCTTALATAYGRMEWLRDELDRGRAALARMSRNSRTREAWLLVTALRVTTRTQLARGLGLSRAGADIQARSLADAGLVTLGPVGRIDWQHHRRAEREPAPLDGGALSEAAADLDATMAEIDQLLARSAR